MTPRKEEDMIALLGRMDNSLKRIDRRLSEFLRKHDDLIATLASGKPSRVQIDDLKDSPLDVVTLLSLPDHLRKTAMVLCKEDEAIADQVANKTGRARAVESGYLNQLCTMGYVKKKRKGRDVYFYIER